MKISNEHVGRLLEARLERIHGATGSLREIPVARTDSDHVTFSTLSEDLRLALAAARSAGDAPDPRIDALRSEVIAGHYHVPARAIADAVLRDLRG